MPETLDPSGQTILKRGFKGGAAEMNRMGIPPAELLNIASSEDRQRVFYGGISDLGSNRFAFLNYWKPGGMMSVLKSEFSTAADVAGRYGVNIPVDVLRAYEERIVTYSTMMGLSSIIQHCDGNLAAVAEGIPSEAVMDELGWTDKRSKMIVSDPAVAWPLQWIKEHGENGTLLFYWYKVKNREVDSMDDYIDKIANAMRADPKWAPYRSKHGIASNMEEDLTRTALNYWIVEYMPDLHRGLINGEVVPTDTRLLGLKNAKGKPVFNVKTPNMGVMPFDDVFWSNLDEPTGILVAKNVFQSDERHQRVIKAVHSFFTYANNTFDKQMRGRLPSEMTVKDIKRYTSLWDLLVGGSQGKNLTDFSKFGDAIFTVGNLYNGIENFQDVVGWMVSEALYAKALAAVSGGMNRGFSEQLFKVLSLGDEDTPRELQAARGGVLGADGAGQFGAIATAIHHFGLHVGTQHYYDALAMLRTGIPDPIKARALGQPVLAIASITNRFFGGKRR